MPLFDYECEGCGLVSEQLVAADGQPGACPHCGGPNLRKLLSAPSSLTGQAGRGLPGAGDTGCCGSRPGLAGCAGPGSCCGKA